MKSIQTIIEEVKVDGSFKKIYQDYIDNYLYSYIIYFPNWNMYFLYINKDFIQMSESLDNLIFISQESKLKYLEHKRLFKHA